MIGFQQFHLSTDRKVIPTQAVRRHNRLRSFVSQRHFMNFNYISQLTAQDRLFQIIYRLITWTSFTFGKGIPICIRRERENVLLRQIGVVSYQVKINWVCLFPKLKLFLTFQTFISRVIKFTIEHPYGLPRFCLGNQSFIPKDVSRSVDSYPVYVSSYPNR